MTSASHSAVSASADTAPHPASHGVALYAQLTARLRGEIAEGRWPVGERLPTVAALAEAHHVAVVTVRQALQALKSEGLVSMDRGRGSFVIRKPAEPSQALRDAINDPLVAEDQLVIDVLARQSPAAVPDELVAGAALYPAYSLIRKRHSHDREPFCLVDLYVAEEVLRALPRGAENFRKVGALIAGEFPQLMRSARTWITLSTADVELARQLGCPFGTPVARVRRRVLDAEGRIVYSGLFRYRGDRFILDFDSSLELPSAAGPRPLEPPA